MWNKLNEWNERGFPLPFVRDGATGKPSMTLMFAWLANMLAIISITALHFWGDKFIATTTACIFAVVQTVLYMMRNIQKAKFDLDDKSIDLESSEDDKKDS